MPRTSNKAAAKKVSVELIPLESPVGFRMYQLLDELIEQHHQDKRAARIALMFNKSWAEEVDGNITLARVTLASDFVRELLEGNDSHTDVVIQVLHGWWMNDAVQPIDRRARLDEALCSFAPVLDKKGDHAEDERGRKLWRHRSPDVQAFTETIERYGLDVTTRGQELAAAIKRSPANFTGCEVCRADETTPNGFISTDKNTVKQCSCVTAWKAIQQELTAVS
jgi:hypothetical protein